MVNSYSLKRIGLNSNKLTINFIEGAKEKWQGSVKISFALIEFILAPRANISGRKKKRNAASAIKNRLGLILRSSTQHWPEMYNICININSDVADNKT